MSSYIALRVIPQKARPRSYPYLPHPQSCPSSCSPKLHFPRLLDQWACFVATSASFRIFIFGQSLDDSTMPKCCPCHWDPIKTLGCCPRPSSTLTSCCKPRFLRTDGEKHDSGTVFMQSCSPKYAPLAPKCSKARPGIPKSELILSCKCHA